MRILRYVAALSLVALISAPAFAQVTPQTLAKLEAQHAAKPGDAKASRALGIALFKLRRFPDAERVLIDASTAAPNDGVTALYLGMSCEEQGKYPAARVAYTKYLATGKTKPAKDDVVSRLAALTQKELVSDAKARVADERRLAGTPGGAMTLAVLPVRVTGDTATYGAIGRGLADLMITDFHTGAPTLTLLERDRVQALLNEIALGRTNNIDPATAVRSGKILQASRMINGTLNVANAANAQFNTSIVQVSTGASTTGANANGAMAAIFTTEKTIVINTLTSMGMTPTAAQRQAILEYKPTQNLQAFLAYSRGLAAFDNGRLDEAASFFDNAKALDPNFAAAAQHASAAHAGQAGQSITTGQIETRLRGTAEGQIVANAERGTSAPAGLSSLGTTIQNALADVNPSVADAIGRTVTNASNRDPTSSTTSNDQTTVKTGTLTIVIKRP